MNHIDKIRLLDEYRHLSLYPDNSGHFYVHHVGSMIIWDSVEIWKPPYLFSFIPVIIQHCFGEMNSFGRDIYKGNVHVMGVSDILFQHTIWKAAIEY